MSDTLSITTVIAAGKRRKIDVLGQFIYCRTASQQEFEIKIEAGSPIKFFPGSKWRPKKEFSSVTVVNKSITDELTLSLVIGPEDFDLSQFRIAPANRIVTVDDVVVAATTAVKVLDANLDRQHALIVNPSGSIRECRVGDANVAANRGIEIPPSNLPLKLQTTAEIWVYNPDAAPVTISVTELLE